MASVLLGAAILSGCNTMEEEFSTAGKKALEAPSIMAGEVSTSSISFSWSPIDNAGQYYYQVINPLGYTVAKGTTTDTYATVKGLKFSTTFKVLVSAIPTAKDAKKLCASSQTELLITTEDPIIIDYEWVLDGKAWFYEDGNTWNKSNVTVGLEKGTNHFIVSSWIGSDGFDLYFDIKDWDGSFPISYHYSTPVFQPVIGQAIDQSGPLGDRGDIRLGHGLGGKSYEFIYWYGNGASYDQGVIDPTGGYLDMWVKDYDDTWCGFRVEFGEYAPEPEPDPVPDADAEESWEQEVAITLNGEDYQLTDLAFDAESGKYTLSSWYGVEGYDVVFTRDVKTGDWIIDPSCSAYAGEDEETGDVALYHGLGKVKPYSVCYVKAGEWVSGLSGNEKKGNIFAEVVGPDGSKVAYKASWPTVTYVWTKSGSYYSGRHDSTAEGTLSYNEVADNYTLIIPQYDNAKVIFQTNEEGAFIPVAGGSLMKSDDTWWWIDYADTFVWVKIPTTSVNLSAGSMTLDIWNGSDEWTDTFAWEALPNINDLVGTYTQETEGYWWSGSTWEYPSWTNDVTITKVDDTTIQIVGLIDCSDPILGTVNEKNSTITMAADQPFQSSYFFQAYATGGDVFAKFEKVDGALSIKFTNNWRVVNAGGSLYWDNIITSLTKK